MLEDEDEASEQSENRRVDAGDPQVEDTDQQLVLTEENLAKSELSESTQMVALLALLHFDEIGVDHIVTLFRQLILAASDCSFSDNFREASPLLVNNSFDEVEHWSDSASPKFEALFESREVHEESVRELHALSP